MSDIYDLSVSDDEAATLYAKEIGQKWLKTPEGKQFNEHYNTESNREKLAEVFNLLDEALTLENLSAAFKKLVASGAIQKPEQIEQARLETERQRNEANRAKWESDCESWLTNHSTLEVKERASTDRAFASWLKKQNVPPIVETMYDKNQLIRQRNELKEQRTKDAPYLNVPESVRDFAESYRRMSFAEVQQRQRDPNFRAQLEVAASAGLV